MENNGKQNLLHVLTSSYGNVNHYCCINISGDEVIYTICASSCEEIYIFDQKWWHQQAHWTNEIPVIKHRSRMCRCPKNVSKGATKKSMWFEWVISRNKCISKYDKVKLATEQNTEMWKWVKYYKSGNWHSKSGEANLNLDSQNLTYIYICLN